MSKNMYGFSMDLNFDKVWVGGKWVKVTSVSNSTAWSADLAMVTMLSLNEVLGM